MTDFGLLPSKKYKKANWGSEELCYLKKQSVRQVKLVQFSRYESCPAKD